MSTSSIQFIRSVQSIKSIRSHLIFKRFQSSSTEYSFRGFQNSTQNTNNASQANAYSPNKIYNTESQYTKFGNKLNFPSSPSFTSHSNPDQPSSTTNTPPIVSSTSPSAISEIFSNEQTTDQFVLTSSQISSESFSDQVTAIFNEELSPKDIEIRADGMLYLPEIKYRAILLNAFGPGGWCLVPRGGHSINGGFLSREYWLICNGKFVSAARGFGFIRGELSDAAEAAKSNALMRCCKDLGIAKDLWNAAYVKRWKEIFTDSYHDGKRTIWTKKPIKED